MAAVVGSRSLQLYERVELGRVHAMRSFIVACIAAIVIAVIAYFALESVQQPVSTAFTSTGTRI